MYLKTFREYIGLSQKEFAKKLDLTQVTIARYETRKMSPTATVIQKYIDVFDANPNYLFLGLDPVVLTTEDYNLSPENNELLKDLNLLLPQDELKTQLSAILIDQVLNKFSDTDISSPIESLLISLKLEGHLPMRPFLFLYYIFRYINENQHELKKINIYKEFLIDLVLRYKVFSIKNNPIFTNKIKEEVEANIELKLNEKECKLLITHVGRTIFNLESKMTSSMVLSHRKIDVNALFPIK